MKKLILLLLGIAIGVAVSYFYFNNKPKTDPIMTKPDGVITSEEAKVLGAAFDARHRLISDSIVMRQDNRSSWYSLQDMRDYLDYAENQAKELGYNMDGVRIYLGAYPIIDQKVGFTTMFIVPTGQKATSQGNMLAMQDGGSGDIPGGDGLNKGDNGDPPNANYPNN